MANEDSELLDQYVHQKSDAAFEEIVRRYRDLVYGSARRQVGNSELAQDVAQAVFIVLARKAGSVPARHLAGWLLTTARLCACDAMKKEIRRLHHEREAAMAKSETAGAPETFDPQIAIFLDEAMARLPRQQSTALALRYLQDQPVTEVAATLGVSANAASKILARSLAKLRRMLNRKGVIVPSVGPLLATLAHESAKKAPAGLAISVSSCTSSSISIAKGVIQMILWTKLKIGAAIAAIIMLAAGTGSVILIEARADAPAAPPAQSPGSTAPVAEAAPSVSPYESPFLELVGCRIKETAALNLSPEPPAPVEATWIQQQYPVIEWSLNPDVASSVAQYTITITPKDDPAGAQTITADKSVSAQALVKELADPGEYNIQVSAVGAGSATLASATVHAIIKPLPSTQIVIDDVQPDGTIRFATVTQDMYDGAGPDWDFGFVNSDMVHLEKMADDEGRPLRFSSTHNNGHYQYRGKYNQPIQPGDPVMMASMGSETDVIRPLGDGVFHYVFRHFPGSGMAVRRIELYRLPAGATLIYASDNITSKVIDGQTQMYMETMIPPGGGNLVEFRYRMGS